MVPSCPFKYARINVFPLPDEFEQPPVPCGVSTKRSNPCLAHSRLPTTRVRPLGPGYCFIHEHAEPRAVRVPYDEDVARLGVGTAVRGDEAVKGGEGCAMLVCGDYVGETLAARMRWRAGLTEEGPCACEALSSG